MNVAVKKIEERKRLIILCVHRKPIEPQHVTCTVHIGHRRPFKLLKVPHLWHLLE